MTDIEVKARELAALYVKAGPIFASKTLGEASDLLATALREARTQALEEAAVSAWNYAQLRKEGWPGLDQDEVCHAVSSDIADRIRALKGEYGVSPAMAVLDEVRRDNAAKADDLREKMKGDTPEPQT
jgi:hypothetical protein